MAMIEVMMKVKELVVYIIILMMSSAMAFADVCFVKPNFPDEDFAATVRYEIVSDDVMKFMVLVEGIDSSFINELEIFYGVTNDFKWSIDELYKSNYEFSSKIILDYDESFFQSKFYTKKNFSNFALHLNVLPTDKDGKSYCHKDLFLLVKKNSINHKVKKGVVGNLLLLKNN